jgi:tRNA threonylcarbamoyladenosine biosynthesis protein TsaB
VPGDNEVLLAIDTSTDNAGLALYDGEWLSESTWNAGRNQTVGLLEEIRRLLESNHLEFDSIRAIGVAVGPGTFNGLRVGLSTAKGLAYGLSVPILGVDTLEIVAYPFRRMNQSIRAFVPAGRGRAVCADYRRRNERWGRHGELRNIPFAQLVERVAEPMLLVGEFPSGTGIDIADDSLIELPSVAERTRRPGILAEIAYRRWDANDTDDIAGLEPMYVHGNRQSSSP